jgi:hypothetical protein
LVGLLLFGPRDLVPACADAMPAMFGHALPTDQRMVLFPPRLCQARLIGRPAARDVPS